MDLHTEVKKGKSMWAFELWPLPSFKKKKMPEITHVLSLSLSLAFATVEWWNNSFFIIARNVYVCVCVYCIVYLFSKS